MADGGCIGLIDMGPKNIPSTPIEKHGPIGKEKSSGGIIPCWFDEPHVQILGRFEGEKDPGETRLGGSTSPINELDANVEVVYGDAKVDANDESKLVCIGVEDVE